MQPQPPDCIGHFSGSLRVLELGSPQHSKLGFGCSRAGRRRHHRTLRCDQHGPAEAHLTGSTATVQTLATMPELCRCLAHNAL